MQTRCGRPVSVRLKTCAEQGCPVRAIVLELLDHTSTFVPQEVEIGMVKRMVDCFRQKLSTGQCAYVVRLSSCEIDPGQSWKRSSRPQRLFFTFSDRAQSQACI